MARITTGSVEGRANRQTLQINNSDNSQREQGIIEAAQRTDKLLEAGKQFINKTIDVQRTSQVSKAVTEAQLEVQQAYSQRVNRRTDENGNATYGALAQDTQTILSDIRERIGSNLGDSVARSRFNDLFSQLQVKQTAQSLKDTQTQQIEDVQFNVTSSIESLVRGSQADSIENEGFYTSDIRNIVEEGVMSGAYTQAQGLKIVNTSERNIRYGNVLRLIETSPASAARVLEGDAATLALDEKDIQALKRVNGFKQRDIESNARQQKRELEATRLQTVSVNTSNLSLGIKRGEVGEAEIAAAQEAGDLGNGAEATLNANKLTTEVLRSRATTSAKASVNIEIGNALASGRNASTFTSENRNSFYADQVNKLEQGQGRSLTLAEKMNIAVPLGGSVTRLSTEFGNDILSAPSDRADELLAAYSLSGSDNSAINQSLTQPQRAVMAYADNLVTSTSISSAAALERARDIVIDGATNERTQLLSRNFNKEDSFKFDELNSTIDELVNDSVGEVFNEAVAPSVREDINFLLKDAYIATGGDVAAAKNLVANSISNLYAVSEFNGVEQIELLPPNLVAPNSSVEELRTSFITEVRDVATNLGDVTDEDLITISGDYTRNGIGQDRRPAYIAARRLATGGTEILTNNLGSPIFWTPPVESMQEREERARAELQQVTKDDAVALRTFRNFTGRDFTSDAFAGEE